MPVEWRKPLGEKYLDFDWIDAHIPKVHSEDSSHGWCNRHPNTTFEYNPTVPAGTTLEVLGGLVSKLSTQWAFKVIKVDEWIEISPSHPYYTSIVRNKQDIIRQIKEGLAHVGRAISDVELLAHDARRYKEILGYFAKKDEHSLKSLFIDYVDSNLPEGVSLRSIAVRWPTIIADFQSLSDEDDTKEKIKKKIDVSMAEAVVLATKVRLYKKWKDLFGGEVKNRYITILQSLEARKASIREYANWVRPLIRRVYMMREVDDHTLAMDMRLPTGVGVPISMQYVEYWAWTTGPGLEPTEPHKAPRIKYETKKGKPAFRIEPYDDVVKKFIPDIEEKHGIKITKEDVMKARERLYKEGSPSTEWYVLIQFPIWIMTYKLPSGLEVEDVDFNKLSCIFLTQNLMLVKFLELIAEEKKLDLYIDELLGERVLVNGAIKKIDDLLKEDFPEVYGKKEEKIEKEGFTTSVRNFMKKLVKALNETFGLKLGFFKGPYDPLIHDRLFYGYGRPFYREVFGGNVWAYLLKNFGGI